MTVDKMIATLQANRELRKVTYYISALVVVKISRQKRLDERDHQSTYIVTAGRPNYAEKIFIDRCYEAGQSLPLRKLQLKYWK
jgi:uncharacterized protein (DUF302 family)